MRQYVLFFYAGDSWLSHRAPSRQCPCRQTDASINVSGVGYSWDDTVPQIPDDHIQVQDTEREKKAEPERNKTITPTLDQFLNSARQLGLIEVWCSHFFSRMGQGAMY